MSRRRITAEPEETAVQRLSPEAERPNRTLFIICGALAREVLAIVERYGWTADVAGVSALDHMFPERIAPDVEKVFCGCGTSIGG